MTSVEDFTSKENVDFIIDNTISYIKNNQKKRLIIDRDFLVNLDKITSTIFKIESKTKNISDINKICINEMCRFILKNKSIFNFEDEYEYVNITAKNKTERLLLTEKNNHIKFDNVINISFESIIFHFICDYNISNENNKIVFSENLSDEKELHSKEIEIKIEPGNYSKEELFIEVTRLMNEKSKIGNFYSVFFNKINSKILLYSNSTEQSQNISYYKDIFNIADGKKFMIHCDKSPLATEILGIKESTYNIVNTASSIFKLKKAKEMNFSINVKGESLEFNVLSCIDTVFTLDKKITFVQLTNLDDFLDISFSSKESQDIEYTIVSNVTYQ
jgi:hypothetical protein